ncbi:exosome complex component 10-like isoform X3 [Petromyzon marinus]|uniref:exosome complex component 10-like isoform X3 n=1 Tax=Petromyzon marinus TaxID=7757 RepID=UPI003F6FDC73
MQISTREEDFIIDTLMLRDDLHILNEAFTNPKIVKVFHGADSDIEWLQRDLGLYVVGLFDTHPAARSLGLARNSLAHLLMHYCSLSTDKQYQLADWRIRPLLPDMLHCARADTHYLLYVYDRVRADLLTKALGRPNLLQLVWDQSRTVALKRYHKPVFTEDSYLELLHKHKQPLDVQQSSAAQLLYAWRDRTARAEDESTGYVLPNHMLMKIAEEMPRELQGVLACCNPVPPLVMQNANELWQLVKQARLVPLIKRLENPLFCPHDGLSLDDRQPITRHVEGARRAVPATRPVLTLFDDSEEQQNEARTAQSSTSQMKAARVLQTFVNPFGMYLPSSDGKSLPFQEKKLDPNSKVFEICSRWKLMKAPEKPKKSSAQPAKAKHASLIPFLPGHHLPHANLDAQRGLHYRHTDAARRPAHPQRGLHQPQHCQASLIPFLPGHHLPHANLDAQRGLHYRHTDAARRPAHPQRGLHQPQQNCQGFPRSGLGH